jgi:phosphopantetheinyl transferase
MNLLWKKPNCLLAGEPLNGRTGHEAGRALLENMYRAHLGHPMPPIAIEPGGKPYFPGNPVYFSITHTRRRVFCALSPCPIGIDAEELDRQVKPGLAKHILSPGELEQHLQAEHPQRALLTFWVLKEAAAKLTGKGIRGYPNDTNFSLTDPRVRELEGCLVAVMEGENHAL